MGGNAGFGGPRSSPGLGGFGQAGFGGAGDRGFGSADADGNRFSSPNSSQLDSFLGLPSDAGLHSLGTGGSNNPFASRSAAQGDAFSNRNAPDFSGAQGAAAGAAVANRNAPEFSGAQGAAVGYAAGFVNTSPSVRYSSATVVRTNFNNYGLYGPEWNGAHPAAWVAAGWGANTAWRAATWASAGAWFGYTQAAPIYYDYGNNVTCQDNEVYVNGQDSGSSSQYYDQASSLASAGAQADAPSDGDWLPLGVFSLCQSGQTTPQMTVQLAVNKQGVLRGNSTDSMTQATQPISGSVDKQSQRVAFTIGDNTQDVIETGLYNLTKDEAPCLMHDGADRTEQWLLVRLKNPESN